MANYGYGGGYSTTSYGEQGGANGGGFMGGSQQGSQEGGGSKTYGKDTVRPVTIKQILEAHQPHPDSDFKIDGSEVTQLSFVGQIHSIASQTTNHTFQIDDGTGLVDVKQWIDSDQDPEHVRPLPKEGEYIHVWGRLKAFNNKRHVGAHVIRPITDFNEVSMVLLEATAVHLYFVRGPPETPGMKSEGGGQGMFVDSNGGGAIQNVGGKPMPATLSATGRKVFGLLQSHPQNNEGLHVSMIAAQLGLQANDVFKAGDELLGEGMIYTTVDDETWAVLEY
ncbi:probable replication protein A subunit [Phialocephala subalpina]|uniref:Probable replication protein A subunit n=1 Tax=Phialocephala subalpina TaxID=576137 RepID=A0A1L7XER0_9HELO|nr:probable replication protein A subunit [Phialocephala subalpina]